MKRIVKRPNFNNVKIRRFCNNINSDLNKKLNKALTVNIHNYENQYKSQSDLNNIFESKTDKDYEKNLEAHYEKFKTQTNENLYFLSDKNYFDNNYSLRKLDKFIHELKENKYKRVSFLLGAGISTAAGIPDFRSKDGLYEKIKGKYNVPKPSDLFHIGYFWENPQIYYTYLKTVIGKTHNPTKSHFFLKHFQDKEILNIIYTQNVDALEVKAGVNQNKIVFAHGRRDACICSKCKTSHSFQKFLEHIEKEQVLFCEKCSSPCKTSVVFFGEGLPNTYFENKEKLYDSDLIFIMGTSLTVRPFSYLMNAVNKNTKIVMINRENLLDNVNILNNVKKIYLGENFDYHNYSDHIVYDNIRFLNLVGDSDIIVDYILNKISKNLYEL